MPEIISVKFKAQWDDTGFMDLVKNTVSNVYESINKGMSSAGGGNDIFSSIAKSLKGVQSASENATKSVEKTAAMLKKEFRETQKDAEKLNTMAKDMGRSYAGMFINANQAIDGLHLNDFMDVMEALKQQFAFLEQPKLAKPIAEAKTLNEMIEQLYEAIVRVNRTTSDKISLPDFERGLLVALREASKEEQQILGTEQASQAVLARNLALQAEQVLMLKQQSTELNKIDAIEKSRIKILENLSGVINQVKALNSSFAGSINYEQVGQALGKLEPLYTLISNTAQQQLNTEQEIVAAAQRLLELKNQVLAISNQVGVSYEKELTSETDIIRLHEMKQRMLNQEAASREGLLQQLGRALAYVQQTKVQSDTVASGLVMGLRQGIAMVETMNKVVQDSYMNIEVRLRGLNTLAIEFSRNFLGPETIGNTNKFLLYIQQVEAETQQLLSMWEKIQAQVSKDVPLPLKNEIDALSVSIGLAAEKMKLLGYAGAGVGGGGANMPPPGGGAGGIGPAPDPEAWNAMRDSMRQVYIEAQKVWRQLQEIGTAQFVKGDQFDGMTASVRVLEAEINKVIKSLSGFGQPVASPFDQVAKDLIGLQSKAQKLAAEYQKLVQNEVSLNEALRDGKITFSQYSAGMDITKQKQAEVSAESEKLKGHLKDVNATVQALGKQASLDHLKKEFSDLDAKLKSLGATHIDVANKTKVLADMMANLRAQSALAGDATGELNKQYMALNTQHKNAAKEVGNLEKATQRYGMNIKNIIKWQLEWYLGAGLIWGAFFKIKNAMTEFLSYSQGLTDVGAITGATTEELKKMDAVVRDVATHSTMGFKAGTDALKIMGQAGMNAADSMKALPTVAMLTTATGASAADTVKLLTTALNVWNMEAKDATKIGNAFAAALNYSKLEIGDLSVAFNYLAPQAKLMGSSLEETLGIVAQMAQMGIKASTIGTGISGFMSRLLAPTEKFTASLKKAGLSMKDLTDGDGRLLSFVEIIRKMEKAGVDVATVFEGLEQRQARSLATALSAGANSFEYMTKAIGGTQAMQVMFDKSMEGTLNRLKTLGNQAMGVAISLGNFLTPAFRGTITVVSELLKTFSDFSGLIMGGLGMAGLLALAPKLEVAFLAIRGAILAVIAAISGAVVPGGAFAAMIAAFGGPITASIIAITALIAAITGLRYAFDDGRKAADNYKTATESAFAKMGSVSEVQKLIGIIKLETATTEQRNAAYDKLKTIISPLSDLYKSNAEGIKALSNETSIATGIVDSYAKATMRAAVAQQVLGAKDIIAQYEKLQGTLKDFENVGSKDFWGKTVVATRAAMMGFVGVDDAIGSLKKKLAGMKEVENVKEYVAGLSDELYDAAKAQGVFGQAMLADIEIMRGARKVAESERKRAIPAAEKEGKEKREHYASSLTATKDYWKSLLEIEKKGEALALDDLDYSFKMRLTSERDYYDARLLIIENFRQEELKKINVGEIAALAELDNKMSKKGVRVDQTEKMMQERNAIIAAAEAKRVDINVDADKKINTVREQSFHYERNLIKTIQDFQYNMVQEGLAQITDATIDAYKKREEANQYLYDHQIITATEYYETSFALLAQEVEAQKDSLNKRFQALIDFEVARQSLPGTSQDERDASNRAMLLASEKLQGDLLKIDRDASGKRIAIWRKSAEDIRKVWEDKGALGVVNKALDDVEKKWNKTWDDIYDFTGKIYEDLAAAFSDIFYDAITGKLKSIGSYFKSLGQTILREFSNYLSQMAAQAIRSNIVIPIQTVLFGAPGSEFAGPGGAGGANAGLGQFMGGGGLSPYLGMLGGGWGLANMMGAGTGGQWGGALGGLAGGWLAGSTGVGLFMAEALSGITSAAGTILGAEIGTIVPIIGTIIGGLLGTLIGGLFDDEDPAEFGMSLRAGQASGYTPGKHWSGEALQQDANMYSEIHYKNVGDASGFAGQLNATFKVIRDKSKELFEEMGLDVSGFSKEWSKWFGEDWATGKTAEEIATAYKNAFAEYIQFASGIDFSQWTKDGEELSETVDRIMTAMMKITKFGDFIDNMVNAIEGDTDVIKQWQDQLAAAEENIVQLKESLENATDPADAEQFAEAWANAVYEIYNATRQLVQGLVSSIENAQMAMLQFNFNLTSKIDELLGTSNAIGVAMDNIMFIYGKIINSLENANNAGALQWIQQGVSAVDQWLSATLSAIQAKYQAMQQAAQDALDAALKEIDLRQKAIGKEIEILNKQLDVMRGWNALLDSLHKTIQDLITQPTNPADVLERLGMAQSEVDRLRGLYAGAQTPEDKQKYATELAAALQAYLSVAGDAYQRPSPEYQAIFSEVVDSLNDLKNDAAANAGDLASIEAQILALQEESNDLQERATQLQQDMVDYTAQMNAEIAAAKAQAAEWYQWLKDTGMPLYQASIDDMKEKLAGILGDKTVEQYLADLQLAAVTELAGIRDILSKIAAQLIPGFVPSFANEGYVSKPTLAMIGDAAGQGEWVLHDNTVKSMLRGMANNYATPPQYGALPQERHFPVPNVNIGDINIFPKSGDAMGIAKEVRKELQKEIEYSLQHGTGRKIIQKKGYIR